MSRLVESDDLCSAQLTSRSGKEVRINAASELASHEEQVKTVGSEAAARSV
jgi:hypothetical protein